MGRKINVEEEKILQKLGKTLKYIRKKKKLTLNDVSNKLHIKADYISKYENGKKEIGYLTLKKLCDFYKIKLSDLFYRNDNPASTNAIVKLSDELKKINDEYLDTAKRLYNELERLK